MTGPKVSVCIPVFNGVRFISAAIESVLRQSYADYELLIIDNRSADGTVALVRSAAGRDRRIRLLVNDNNIGMVGNWNRCLAEARGEFIKYLFSDDLLASPHALSRMVDVFERDASIALVASGRTIIDEKSAVRGERSFDRRDRVLPGGSVIKRCLEEQRNLVGEPSAVLFRKEAAKRGFDPRYRQLVDLEMWFHLLERGSFAFLAEPLCSFRVHENQETERNNQRLHHIHDFLLLYEEYLPRTAPAGLSAIHRRYLMDAQLHQLWKRSRRTPVLREEARLTISRYYKPWEFLVHRVFYKLINPLYKIKRFLSRHLGQQR